MTFKQIISVIIFFTALFALLGFKRPGKIYSGILAPKEPVQISAQNHPKMRRDNYLITPLASYDITAKILLRESYWLGRESNLSPLDLTLAWGSLSDKNVTDQLKIWSGHRKYYYSYSKEPPVPDSEINAHIANTHLIPASATIERKLKSFDVNNVVHLKGYLVKAEAADGWQWESSLTREDSGDGACEVMWVEDATLVK